MIVSGGHRDARTRSLRRVPRRLSARNQGRPCARRSARSRQGANFGQELSHVYFTKTLDAAAWGAELALGDGPGRIYLAEPTGPFEDDPNLTDKRFPGNPTRSFRSREPVRIIGELEDWEGHAPEQIEAMRAGLAGLAERGENDIID